MGAEEVKEEGLMYPKPGTKSPIGCVIFCQSVPSARENPSPETIRKTLKAIFRMERGFSFSIKNIPKI